MDALLINEKTIFPINQNLRDRCEQFGTDIEIKDQIIKVNFND